MTEECMFAIDLTVTLSENLMFIALAEIAFIASIALTVRQRTLRIVIGINVFVLYLSAAAGYAFQKGISVFIFEGLDTCPLEQDELVSTIQDRLLMIGSGMLLFVLFSSFSPSSRSQ